MIYNKKKKKIKLIYILIKKQFNKNHHLKRINVLKTIKLQFLKKYLKVILFVVINKMIIMDLLNHL